jgi:SAM-dependent methyltransferase
MRPDDLAEYSRQAYAGSDKVERWGNERVVGYGLTPDEKKLLEKISLKEGRVLVMGVGGGREAIYLARQGYEVTGIDFIPQMVEKAKENAAKQGLVIDGLVQEISKLAVPAESYDIVWLSAAMYSGIPTRNRRIEMLKRIKRALKPGGYFACGFQCYKSGSFPKAAELIRKTVAFLTLGNREYENGDTLWYQFLHNFASEEELKAEFAAGGFKIIFLDMYKYNVTGTAVLQKDTAA